MSQTQAMETLATSPLPVPEMTPITLFAVWRRYLVYIGFVDVGGVDAAGEKAKVSHTL